MPKPEAHGTFACPICGEDSPHAHINEDIKTWLDAQASRFGYVLTSSLCVVSTDETLDTLAAQRYALSWKAPGVSKTALVEAFKAGLKRRDDAKIALADDLHLIIGGSDA